MPPTDLCNWMDLRAHPRALQTPPDTRRQLESSARWATTALANHANRALSGQAVLPYGSTTFTYPPLRRPLAAVDWPQPVGLEHLLSWTDAGGELEKRTPPTTARYTVSLSGIVSPNSSCRNTTRLIGSPHALPRERSRNRAAPKVLSFSWALAKARLTCFGSAGLPTTPQWSDTFVTVSAWL